MRSGTVEEGHPPHKRYQEMFRLHAFSREGHGGCMGRLHGPVIRGGLRPPLQSGRGRAGMRGLPPEDPLRPQDGGGQHGEGEGEGCEDRLGEGGRLMFAKRAEKTASAWGMTQTDRFRGDTERRKFVAGNNSVPRSRPVISRSTFMEDRSDLATPRRKTQSQREGSEGQGTHPYDWRRMCGSGSPRQ